MSATDPIPPGPRRFPITLPRPPWIGVATIVLIVVVVGLQLGLPVYRQHAAIREIERLGGLVQTNKVPPAWLRKFVRGRDTLLFDAVWNVDLSGTQFTDAAVERLKHLRGLATELDYGPGLHHSVSLHLEGSNISDTALENLNGLVGLQAVYLGKTRITDAGLARLDGSWLTLDLTGTPITGTGLSGMPDLWWVTLNDSGVTDEGMACIGKMKNLFELHLDGTSVTDAGLKHLRGMSNLSTLSLAHTQIADVALQHIENLHSLVNLDVRETDVTDAGLAELKRALPGLEIEK